MKRVMLVILVGILLCVSAIAQDKSNVTSKSPPQLVRFVAPAYPRKANDARMTGTVIVRISVGKNGQVTKVDLVSGHPFFAAAVLDALKQWSFVASQQEYSFEVICRFDFYENNGCSTDEKPLTVETRVSAELPTEVMVQNPVRCVVVNTSAVEQRAQSGSNDYVSVEYEIDGKAAVCSDFGVELRLNGKAIKPKLVGQSFKVPRSFKKPFSAWSDTDKVDIVLTCNGDRFVFPRQRPAFVKAGDWRLGKAGPLYALEQYGWTHEFDRGVWLGYLIFEGEPGVVTFVSEPNPPAGIINALQQEQANASGQHARDVAYELAVFQVDYQDNRDYLLGVLNRCLLRPKESSEDDECNRDLVAFVTNLYWRGDSSLLSPLFQLANTRRDVIGDVGRFYADVLDSRSKAAIDLLGSLTDRQQTLVCGLAYNDDLNSNAPKLHRVQMALREEHNGVAARCLNALRE